jgi:hypothetical protein
MPRQLKSSWIDTYVNSIVQSSDAPENFHFWSAATIVSAALRRNIYYVRGARKLFANLYTILVARPGIGKGESIIPAGMILEKSNTANLLADRMTMPHIISRMHKGFQRIGQNSIGFDHTACMFAEELSTFMKASEDELDTLNQLWNSPDKYGTGTISRADETIENPSFVLLGGTTPKWLCRSIPEHAAGGGFTRRVNFVYAKNNSKITPFPKPWTPPQVLIDDLKHMSTLQGEMVLTQAAIPVFEKLYKECKVEDDFDDETSATYKTSQWTNVIKLAMVLSICQSDSMMIDKNTLQRAIKLIEQVRHDLGLVFSYIGESDTAAAGAKVVEFINKVTYATTSQIMRHMSKDTTYDILTNTILPTLVHAGILQMLNLGNTTKYFDPIHLQELQKQQAAKAKGGTP